MSIGIVGVYSRVDVVLEEIAFGVICCVDGSRVELFCFD
jgi:hypothetical protein